MSISLFPKSRPGITKEEMTWNELFYYCLQKNFWIIAAGVLFIVLFVYMIVAGLVSNNIFGILLLVIIALGLVYLFAALPASMIYATVMRAKFNKAKK